MLRQWYIAVLHLCMFGVHVSEIPRTFLSYPQPPLLYLITFMVIPHGLYHSIRNHNFMIISEMSFYSWFSQIRTQTDIWLLGLLKGKVKVKSLNRVRLFATRWTVAHQAPPSMGFSRQEYWSGLPCPSPEDLPDPGIEPRSPALQADDLTSEPPGKIS